MFCAGCHKESTDIPERYDAYGIYTGIYCDKCYDDVSIYTYRKDDYFDPSYAGENLDEDY